MSFFSLIKKESKGQSNRGVQQPHWVVTRVTGMGGWTV